MNPQTIGIETLGGTYVFDLRTSNANLKVNRFFWNLRRADARDAFLANPKLVMHEAGLTETEMGMVNNRDWIGLIRHGVNFFAMEKFARLDKTSNMAVYASMRGESLEDFLRTRRVPGLR